MSPLKHCLTVTTLLRVVRWLQSEDDEPAVKISSIFAVLSLTLQPYLDIRTDYAKWITGNYFCIFKFTDYYSYLALVEAKDIELEIEMIFILTYQQVFPPRLFKAPDRMDH